MTFYTSASLVVKRLTLVFQGFHRNIELKTSKHEFAGIRMDLKAKKLREGQAGRNSFRLNNMWSDSDESAIGTQDSNFSYLDFPVCFPCYPPQVKQIILKDSIWLKFVDTSFRSSQKKSKIHRTSLRHFLRFWKIVAWSSKLPRNWN